KHEGPKNIIIEKLQFDASQIANYEELIVTHRDQVQDKDAQIRERKKTLYSLLTATETQQIDQDSLLNSIGTIQKEIELLHFHHFQKIKKICTPKQVPAFTALAKDLVKIFKPQKARDPKIPR
ncbi:MAG: protein CpxP, partial [Patiriisocius sp.]